MKIALIGMGPHAKRIYLNYFKKYKINLGLVVELDSKKDNIKNYLKENNFKNTPVFTLDDKYKDNVHLPIKIFDNLKKICETLEITHIIISTEPKAHNMYLEFALKNNIHVLTDKPITVNKNMLNKKSISKTRKQYYNILSLANKSKAICKVMCQRQYHKGYEYIKKILNDVVSKYKIPITYIDIYHCDGAWEMAHDLDKENHPYKYGYGKLFHSGYHFIDLLSEFLKINNQLTKTKRIVKGEVYSNILTPNDEANIFNSDDYNRIFKNQKIPDFYQKRIPNFNKYGEKNLYSLMKFTNYNNQTITNVNLNLLHLGFSRRGWIETRNFYKENGRVRHERINIQVGTLLNIQVHSYQSKEINNRLSDNNIEEATGGLEHFDIDIYRNTDIIGGSPYERVTLGNLYKDKEKQNILGYNELAREIFLTNFLNGKCKKSDVKDQALSIELLTALAKSVYNDYKRNKKVEIINLKGKNIYPFKLKDLKVYSNHDNFKQNKICVSQYKLLKQMYTCAILVNYMTKRKSFEVYLSINTTKEIVSTLFYKEFKNKYMAKVYGIKLKIMINILNINKVIKRLK